MHLPQAYRSLPRPSSLIKPSHPPIGVFAPVDFFLKIIKLNLVPVITTTYTCILVTIQVPYTYDNILSRSTAYNFNIIPIFDSLYYLHFYLHEKIITKYFVIARIYYFFLNYFDYLSILVYCLFLLLANMIFSLLLMV